MNMKRLLCKRILCCNQPQSSRYLASTNLWCRPRELNQVGSSLGSQQRFFADSSRYGKKSRLDDGRNRRGAHRNTSPGSKRKKNLRGKSSTFPGERRGTTSSKPKVAHDKRETSAKSKRRSTPVAVPPAILSATASPFVYVAGVALSNGDIDPRELFNESLETQQNVFAGLHFEYFAPKTFNHTLDDKTSKTPEVAFLGRSNVGKSSLMNAVMRRDLAKCSKHPGRTQQPYYYGLVPNLGSTESGVLKPSQSQGFIVDLPGYGFANAPDAAVDGWQRNTQKFLQSRLEMGTLERVFLLIDSRRGPLSLDQYVMTWFEERGIPYTVVLTKADCVSRAEIVKEANLLCMRYHQQFQEKIDDIFISPFFHLTSSKNGDGINELKSAIELEFLLYGT